MPAGAPQSSIPPLYLYYIKDTLNVCSHTGMFLHADDNAFWHTGSVMVVQSVF